MATLYIRDKYTRKIFFIEESFSSLVWTERYQECGDFVLDIPLHEANFDAYKIGNYISFDESKESMIIESVSITENFGSSEKEPLLEISGRSLSSLLMRRVNASQIFSVQEGKLNGTRGPDSQSGLIRYSGQISEVIESILNDDLINPRIPLYYWRHKENGSWVDGYSYNSVNKADIRYSDFPERKISNFIYENTILEDSNVLIDKSYDKIKTLYDIVVNIAKNNMFGFRSYFRDTDIVFETYKGADRSSVQNDLSPVIFDPTMDNITYVNFFNDITSYKTNGFVYTDSPLAYAWKNTDYDEARIFQGYSWYNVASDTDIDRFEVPLDVRSSISVMDSYSSKSVSSVLPEDSVTDSDEDNQYVSWSEYYNMIVDKVGSSGSELYEDGDYDFVSTSEGAVDPIVNYLFDRDYFIGDLVSITNQYNTVMQCYIDEVVRSYDSNGNIVTPNFKSIEDYDDGEEDM